MKKMWILFVLSFCLMACSTQNEVHSSESDGEKETIALQENDTTSSEFFRVEETAAPHEIIVLENGLLLDIGSSVKFNMEEIADAAEALLAGMFDDCVCTFISYDEALSDDWIQNRYLTYGKGRVNGAKEENVLVFRVNFEAGADADVSLTPNSPNVTEWNDCVFIMLRDAQTGEWSRDDWGLR